MDTKRVIVKPLTGGLTNVLFTCELPSDGGGTEKNRKIVVRLYGEGTSHFFDSAVERR